MSHTLLVILGGLVMLVGVYGVASRRGTSLHRALPLFAALWAVAAAVNLWVGVVRAGYSLAQELPIFVMVFAVPVLIAWGIARRRP